MGVTIWGSGQSRGREGGKRICAWWVEGNAVGSGMRNEISESCNTYVFRHAYIDGRRRD